MKPFIQNIEKLTNKNNVFRRVIYTAKNMQLVLMTILPGEEIGEEIHKTTDQFFRIESGVADFYVNRIFYRAKEGDAVIIPKGFRHNVINSGKSLLKLYTIYAPPIHKDGLVQSHGLRFDI